MIDRIIYVLISVALSLGSIVLILYRHQKNNSDTTQIVDTNAVSGEIQKLTVELDDIQQEIATVQEQVQDIQKDTNPVSESSDQTVENHGNTTTEQGISHNDSRQRKLYSTKYTLVSDRSMAVEQQMQKQGRIVHHATQAGKTGRYVIIQTKDDYAEFIQKMFDWQDNTAANVEPSQFFEPIVTEKGLTRVLYNGPIETNVYRANIADHNIFVIDTLENRGCMEYEECITGTDFLSLIGK